jgi:hypothetical protein
MTAVATRVEFRCKGKVHGVTKEYPNGEKYLEVRCKDHWCTDREPGVVVFHYFDYVTGDLHHTKKYRSATQSGKLESNSNER